jgi:hypothetical protein
MRRMFGVADWSSLPNQAAGRLAASLPEPSPNLKTGAFTNEKKSVLLAILFVSLALVAVAQTGIRWTGWDSVSSSSLINYNLGINDNPYSGRQYYVKFRNLPGSPITFTWWVTTNTSAGQLESMHRTRTLNGGQDSLPDGIGVAGEPDRIHCESLGCLGFSFFSLCRYRFGYRASSM